LEATVEVVEAATLAAAAEELFGGAAAITMSTRCARKDME